MNKEEKLKRAIIEQYGSIRSFSKEVSIPSSTITSALDKGIGGMSVDKVIAICDKLNLDIKTFDVLSRNDGEHKIKIISNYEKLNDLGKEKLVEYSNDLVENPKYSSQSLAVELINAAHDDDLTDEEKQTAEEILRNALAKLKK